MPDHKLDEGAMTFWSLLAEMPSAVADSKATSQGGSSKAADLTRLQPLQSMATAEMPSTTAGMPRTTAGMPSATAGMPSTTAGMPNITAETPSTTVASDSAHKASVSAELSTSYTHEHTQQQESKQQQPEADCPVNGEKACLPNHRADGSPSTTSVVESVGAVISCELMLPQTDTVDQCGHNSATAKGGLIHSPERQSFSPKHCFHSSERFTHSCK